MTDPNTIPPQPIQERLDAMEPAARKRFLLRLARAVENDLTGVWTDDLEEVPVSHRIETGTEVADLLTVGRSGNTFHRPDGKMLSTHELEAIATNAELIRAEAPSRLIEPDAPTLEHIADEVSEPMPGSPAPGEGQRHELVLSFIDQTKDAEAAARDAAEVRRREELSQGGRLKRMLKSMWMGENGIAGGIYFQRYKKEALERIQSENDILAFEDSDRSARVDAQMATIGRFSSEYDEAIHGEAGEQREELDDTSQFSIAMKDLIRRYVSGEITDPSALAEERGRIIEQLYERSSTSEHGSIDLVGEGKVRLDNLTQVAESIKGMVEHGDSLDRILEGMKIYSGEARSNVRSEAHMTKIDRMIERLQESKFGSLVGPETIGTAAAVALGIARAGKGSLARAAGVTVIPGVLGGVFAALRENTRVKQERSIHSREMAQGKLAEAGSRRDAMERARYEAVSAQVLTTELRELFEGDSLSSSEAVQRAYEALAGVEARVHMSDKRSIDLISYSGVTNIESERFDLDIERARAKVQLAAHLGELPSAYRSALGIDINGTVDEALARNVDVIASLDQDISAKDEAFTRLKAARVAKAAAIGFTTSFAIGIGAQEALAFGSPSYDGLVEHAVNPGGLSKDGSQTLLEGVFNGQPASVNYVAPSSTYDSHPVGNHPDVVELPADYKLQADVNGTLAIENPDGTRIADKLAFDTDGKLTPDSLDVLRQNNINIVDTTKIIDTPTTTTQQVDVRDYIVQNPEQVEHIKRDFWYDNNTPSPRFDKNELGLDWAGDNNNGIGGNGSIEMSVSSMTSDGSVHGLERANWAQEAGEGHLKLAVSATKDTQSNVFMVDVDRDGSISIPADSPVAQFFSIENGRMQFHGAYAEVVETRADVDGTLHVAPLATVTGDHSVNTVPQEVTSVTHEIVPHYKIIPPEREVAVPGKTIEGFGMPGFVPRRPLEGLIARRRPSPYEVSGGSLGGSPEEIQETFDDLARERSPRLLDSPNAELNSREELDWYRQELVRRRGADGVAAVDRTISETPELRDLPAVTETIVTMPVGGAFESENIYNTLSLYAQQDPESLAKTTILLNVNWLDTVANDPERMKLVHKTLAEIERARASFPQLKLAVVTHEYSKDKVERTKGVIGYAVSDLVDTALMSIQQRMQSGELPPERSIVIQRHDADMPGMSRRHLKNLLRAAQEARGSDIFKGATRLDTKQAERYPGWGITGDIFNLTTLWAAKKGGVQTGGANFAIRAEMLAAVGGLGDLATGKYGSGAGSDDVMLGVRVAAARAGRGTVPRVSYAGPTISDGITAYVEGRDVMKYVPGMDIDTSSDRFLPMYVRGEHWVQAWTPGVGSFNRGEGGYGARTQEAADTTSKPEKFGRLDTSGMRKLEHVLSMELSYMDGDMRDRLLALRFSGTPGAYRLTNTPDGGVRFTFTTAGRKYARRYMNQDRYGRTYGRRKVERLYGRDGRTRLGTLSPLASAI